MKSILIFLYDLEFNKFIINKDLEKDILININKNYKEYFNDNDNIIIYDDNLFYIYLNDREFKLYIKHDKNILVDDIFIKNINTLNLIINKHNL